VPLSSLLFKYDVYGEATEIEIILIAKASEQGDQIGQFFANWANFRGEI
jgi:hypothetical protein